MKSICLCFQIHHSFHLQTFRFLDIGGNKSYYNLPRIEKEITEAAATCYLPSNDFILSLIHKYKEKFKFTFYISGSAIELFLMYAPEVLTSFRTLADTGQVEFLGGTSCHSLVSLTNQKGEFYSQVKAHQSQIENLFGKKPLVFANSDLIYSNQIGKDISDFGYRSVLTNSSRKTLIWRSPNYVYSNCIKPQLQVYFRNELISNELESALNNLKQKKAANFLSLLNDLKPEEPLLNIYLDYLALRGPEISKKQQYLLKVLTKLNTSHQLEFIFPSEIKERYESVGDISSIEPICYVKDFHPLYYPGNELQREAITQLYKLKPLIDQINDPMLTKDWQCLQTSNHIHTMDHQHPNYQNDNPFVNGYGSKYEAFINYMNVLDDYKIKVKSCLTRKVKKSILNPEKNKSTARSGTPFRTINLQHKG